MKRKRMKRSALMLTLSMCLTSFAFPVTSGAAADETGKIIFKDAELKELTLSSTFKQSFNVPDSVSKAKFALINDKTPTYVAVTEIGKVGEDISRTPVELKSDGKDNLYAEVTYDPDSYDELAYQIITVDKDQAPLSTSLALDSSAFIFSDGVGILYSYLFYSGEIEFSKLDRGTPGKIQIRYIGTNNNPFKSVSYKTSKDGEYKKVSFSGKSSELIDLSSKYFAVKFETNDFYRAGSYELLVEGEMKDSNFFTDDQDSFVIEDITSFAPSSSNPLNDFGYIVNIGAGFPHFDDNPGISYSEPVSGDLTYKLNKEGDTVKSGDVTIKDLEVEKGELCLYGVEYGITPYTLTVQGTNKVEYLVFDTEVTVICEAGSSIAFDSFNYEDPDPSATSPVPEFKLGANTVYDKANKMFKSTAEPTAKPTEAEPTATTAPAEPTSTTVPAKPTEAEPTATTAPAEPTATTAPAEPTAAEPTVTTAPADPTATATPAEAAATATPTATPTAAEEPAKPGEDVTAPQEKVVTVKNTVYKLNNDNTASFAGVDTKTKNVSIPASVKVDGKSYKVTKIASGAFKKSKAQSVTLGKNVTTVEKGAFNNCGKLTTIVTNEKLQIIEAGAITKCPKLRIFNIKSKKLKKIDKKAFSGVKFKKIKISVKKKYYSKVSKMLINAGFKKSNIKKV